MEMDSAKNENSNVGFRDILTERRGTSDVLWASRKWVPKVAHVQPVKLAGDLITLMVLQSPQLNHVINRIHQKHQVPVDELYKNAKEILKEIGYKRKLPVIRWFGIFTAKILKRLYSGVYLNESKLLEIKYNMGANPVLFVPSHKSYCDFVLMAYLCFHFDVEIPRIAAGMDFASMAVIGNLLREACAFFIRRSFNNDKLYSAIFDQYVQTLVIYGGAAIEFFIEGTRSRTGKSLPPRYGFLSMALKPYFFGLVADISIVPVHLSYDRVLEEVLFAYELLGVPKPKESTKGFIKALSLLKENYGNVYINFGNAISAKKFFGDKIDRSIHNVGPVHLQELLENENKQIIHLAHAIINKQKKLTVLNYFNLIALILNHNIKVSCQPLCINELKEEVKWLFSMLKVLLPKKSAIVINDITKDIILQHLALHKPLIYVSTDEKIFLGKIYSSATEIDQTQLKGHMLSSNTLDVAIPLIILQNYVNPCAYFLVFTCFIALIVHSLSNNCSISKGNLFNEFKFLYSVFAFEFVFHNDYVEQEFYNAFAQSQHLRIINWHDDLVEKGENEKFYFFLVHFLSSFIPGYCIVAECLLKSAKENHNEGQLLRACQQRAESQLTEKMSMHPANLSLDVFKNALQAFVSMEAISKIKGDTLKYGVNINKLKTIQSKLKLFDACLKTDHDFVRQLSKFVRSGL